MTQGTTAAAAFDARVEALRRRHGLEGRKSAPPVVPDRERLTPELRAAVDAVGGIERCNRRLHDLWSYRPAVRMALFSLPERERDVHLGVHGADDLPEGPTVLVAPHVGDQKVLPHLLRAMGRSIAQFDVRREHKDRSERWYRTIEVGAPGSALAAIASVRRGEILVWQPDAPATRRTKHDVPVDVLGYRRSLNPTIAHIVRRTNARVLAAFSVLRDPPTAGADVHFRACSIDEGSSPTELLQRLCDEGSAVISEHVDQWRLWSYLDEDGWAG